jgi:hypothetical protein
VGDSRFPSSVNRPDRYELVKGADCRAPLCASAAECHGRGCRLVPVPSIVEAAGPFEELVCEEHPDVPWDGGAGCCGAPGVPPTSHNDDFDPEVVRVDREIWLIEFEEAGEGVFPDEVHDA